VAGVTPPRAKIVACGSRVQACRAARPTGALPRLVVGGEDGGEEGVVDLVVAGLGEAVAGAAAQEAVSWDSCELGGGRVAAQVEAGDVGRERGELGVGGDREEQGDRVVAAAAAQGGEALAGEQRVGGERGVAEQDGEAEARGAGDREVGGEPAVEDVPGDRSGGRRDRQQAKRGHSIMPVVGLEALA
jgi:hypothetical protein